MRIDFILILALFACYSLVLPGFRIKKYNFVLCGSSIKEREIPEIVLWLVFLALLPIYILLPLAGGIAMLALLLMWFAVQCVFTLRFIFFPNEQKIKGYNSYFKDTHHIIKPSDKRLVPDTYHIVLFVLMIVCLIAVAVNLWQVVGQRLG